MSTHAFWNQKLMFFIIAVITFYAQTTHCQSYLLTLSQNQLNIFTEDEHILRATTSNSTIIKATATGQNNQTDVYTILPNSSGNADNNNNSTLIVFKNTFEEQPVELSQTAMDIITIVWYVATFLALAAFFALMACSDRRCNSSLRNSDNANSNSSGDAPNPPPTPSPSYSEFAPPSYETVVKMQHDTVDKPSIYVIPYTHKDDDNTTNGSWQPHTPTTTPPVHFYTVDELHKFSS